MVWWLILPILAPLITYGVGAFVGLLLVNFFLKQIISVVAIVFAGIILLQLAKNIPKLKKNQALLYILLAVGFLSVPIIINSGVGKLIGLASYAPIVPASSVIATGNISVPGTQVVVTNDIGLLMGFGLAALLIFTKRGQEMLNKIMRLRK